MSQETPLNSTEEKSFLSPQSHLDTGTIPSPEENLRKLNLPPKPVLRNSVSSNSPDSHDEASSALPSESSLSKKPPALLHESIDSTGGNFLLPFSFSFLLFLVAFSALLLEIRFFYMNH